MSSHKRLPVILGVLVIASMVLAACGPQAGPAITQIVGTAAPIVQTQIVEIQGTPQTIVVTATPEPVQVTEFKSADPTSLVQVVFGDAETFDPALDYETGGGQVLQNVYETLIFFDHADPVSYVPMLATEVPSVENGGISEDGLTYIWKIREGVKFHDGADMTPEDVAYTFQRGLLQGGTASPQWLFYEAFFGNGIHDIAELIDPEGSLDDDRELLSASDPAALLEVCEKVQAAITFDDAAGTVTFNLVQPWGIMNATVAGFWGSIVDKDWAVANGAWDGDCATWQNFYATNSEEANASGIGAKANGTGPYMLDHWTPKEEYVLVANESYWRTEPVWEGGPSGPAAIKRVTVKVIDEWSTRLAMLQAGDADFVTLGGAVNYPQVDPLVGEECSVTDYTCTETDPNLPLRVFKGLATATRADAFLAWDINVEGGNNFVGSGQLDGNGIPPTFFSDIHIRKAFQYCFDWDAFIQGAQNGEGVQAYTVMLPNMIGDEPDREHYSYDPDQCAAEFQASEWAGADGTPLWDLGFRMSVAYNTGNLARQTAAQILQSNISAVNDKFIIEVVGLPWPTFLQNQRARKLPIFFSGWIEDLHDPHNWVVPYTIQTYGARQGLPEEVTAQFQEIINRGVAEADPAARQAIYEEFNDLYYELAPTILLSTLQGRHYQQRWMEGYYNNPILAGHYFYAYSKK